MKNYQEAKVFLLPINRNTSNVLCEVGNKLTYQKGNSIEEREVQAHHLYITSGEEIKEGDSGYFVSYDFEMPYIYFMGKVTSTDLEHIDRRVIATTNPDYTNPIGFMYGDLFFEDRIQEGKIYYPTNVNQPVGISKTFFINEGMILPEIPESFITHYVNEYNRGNILTDIQVECVYQYHSSKEFYGEKADWITCEKDVYNSIKKELPNCPTRIKTLINSENYNIYIKTTNHG